MPSLIYKFPGDREKVASVVESIPHDWGWISGNLMAPRDLIGAGNVSKDSALKLSRFYSIKPTIGIAPRYSRQSVKESEYSGRDGDKIREIILERKFPEVVIFNEVGFNRTEISMQDAISIAKGFILLGYKGGLIVYRDFHNNSSIDNSARIEINPDESIGTMIGINATLPPYIGLAWFEELGGKREHLESVVEAIKRAGLEQIVL